MVNKEYVCSVKKGHLFSGSVADQAAPPECCGKPMIELNAGSRHPARDAAPQEQPKKEK